MKQELSAAPSSAGASASEAVVAQAKPRRFQFDQRYIAPLFITCILIAAHLSYGILESPQKTGLAILASIGVEMALSKLFTGKWPHLASAYISGISVGILIRSPEIWPYALCSAIAITSKYVIRVKGRHIWNPSNFAIAMMLLIASDTVATLSIQWGNHIYAMMVIWALGSIIISRLHRFHITLTYVVSFLAFAVLRSVLQDTPLKSEISPITGPMYQLYIFFMITDPKTTVLTKKGQILVAFLVAAVECVLRMTGSYFAIHAPYYALFTVGPIANLVEIYLNSRKPKPEAPAVPATAA